MTTSRNHSADFLRGLAALNVMNAHFVCLFYPKLMQGLHPGTFEFAGLRAPNAVLDPVLSLFYNGHFAVMIFFVLSGFVLGQPFFNQDKDRIRQRLFGRYLRLNLPIAASILLAFVLAGLGLFYHREAAALSGDTVWLPNAYNPATMGYENLVWDMTIGGVFDGSGIFNPPLWSLRIEFIGSLILLSFLAIVPNNRFVSALVALLLLLFGFFGTTHDFLWIAAMILGAALHALPRRLFSNVFVVALCLAFGLFLGGYHYNIVAYQWIPTIGTISPKDTANVVGALIFLTPLLKQDYRMLHSRVGDYLGKISFSLYLLHFPILCSLICFIKINANFPGSSIFAYVMFFVTTILCAHVFEWAVDRPGQRLASRFSRWAAIR